MMGEFQMPCLLRGLGLLRAVSPVAQGLKPYPQPMDSVEKTRLPTHPQQVHNIWDDIGITSIVVIIINTKGND